MSQGCCDEGVQRPRLPRKCSEVTTSALFGWKEAYQRDRGKGWGQGRGDSAGGPPEPGFQTWDPEGGVRKRDQEGWAPLWR